MSPSTFLPGFHSVIFFMFSSGFPSPSLSTFTRQGYQAWAEYRYGRRRTTGCQPWLGRWRRAWYQYWFGRRWYSWYWHWQYGRRALTLVPVQYSSRIPLSTSCFTHFDGFQSDFFNITRLRSGFPSLSVSNKHDTDSRGYGSTGNKQDTEL